MSEVVELSKRAAKTRAALLEAGAALIADRPIDAISIEELASAAGVAKGSFFNHFEDKKAFAKAVAGEIRGAIAERVRIINKDVSDPIETLVGGMIASVGYALDEPQRTRVLARADEGMAFRDHPLIRGLLEVLQEGVAAKIFRPEAARSGVLFWLGCCRVLMGGMVEQNVSIEEASGMLADMLVLSLSGLGVAESELREFRERGRLLTRLETACEQPPARRGNAP